MANAAERQVAVALNTVNTVTRAEKHVVSRVIGVRGVSASGIAPP